MVAPTPTAIITEGVLLRCAICQADLTPDGDMALISFLVRRKGEPRPVEYRMYACSSAHAAEAMRRTAVVIDERRLDLPTPGSPDFPRRHGVLVGARD